MPMEVPDAALMPPVREIARLVNNLRAEVLHHRVEAVSRVKEISRAFGPERTRREILPFLQETADDEDEYLLAMAQQLGAMTDSVGGPEFLPALLGPLEILACAEERAVRDAAVESLGKVFSGIPDGMFGEAVVPLLRGMAKNQWHTGRMSACVLLPLSFPRLSPSVQAEALAWAAELAADPVPTVRKKLCLHVGALCSDMAQMEVEQKMLPLLEKFAQDEQDSVRSQLLEAIVPVAKATPPLLQGGRLLQLTLGVAADESWRVRWSFGKKVVALCDVFSPELSASAFCASYAALLNDGEPEVRVAACDGLTKKCAAWSKDQLMEYIVPACRKLVSDEIDYVRRCAALHVTGLAPALGHSASLGHILPLTLALLRDTDPEVRLHVVSNLRPLYDTLGLESIKQTLLPAIKNLAEAPQWRTRIEIVKLGPTLAEQIGEQFFNENLASIVLNWLCDDVYAVREAAARNLQTFLAMFGPAWGTEHIAPKLRQMCAQQSYIPRYTACLAVKLCAQAESGVDLAVGMLSHILELVEDPVANIRINAAETMAILGQAKDQLSSEHMQRITQSLDILTRDPDTDVKHAALQSKRYIREGIPPGKGDKGSSKELRLFEPSHGR
mmetsp:Transcript_30581/g.97616  ORF Transcript_30581/g.97616 Transcript_30581/m.97616 type:complete len:615 (-) Transcript_30581:576-2420(-)